MNQAQIDALSGLVERALTAAELSALDPLVSARNDIAIADILSAGRKKYISRAITERGVRAALPITESSAFLKLLKATSQAADIPQWLADVLTSVGIDAGAHPAYFDTIQCAHSWLSQEAGIDLGVKTTRDMLDLIALGDSQKYGPAVVKLKALAEQPNPVHFNQVSDALNKAEGRMTL